MTLIKVSIKLQIHSIDRFGKESGPIKPLVVKRPKEKPIPDLNRLVKERTTSSAVLNWEKIDTNPINLYDIKGWTIEYNEPGSNSVFEIDDIPANQFSKE